jgi:hypothetical protein
MRAQATHSNAYAIPASVLRELPMASSEGDLDQGRAMSEVQLPAAVREHILTELTGPNAEEDELAEASSETVLSLFQIGPGLAPVLRVKAHGGLACGATGNCTILFLDTATGAVMLAGNGWKVVVLRPLHAGAHDLAILQNTSACAGLRYEYRFDGRRYRMIAETETKSAGCPQ